MCKLGRVHTQATTIFLTHAHQWHVGWDYGKINETRSGTLLKTKAWTSQFPLESVNSWQDRSRWKDRAIFKLFANFCHRAGDTRSPSWGPSEWRPGSHYQLCSNRDQCLRWQGGSRCQQCRRAWWVQGVCRGTWRKSAGKQRAAQPDFIWFHEFRESRCQSYPKLKMCTKPSKFSTSAGLDRAEGSSTAGKARDASDFTDSWMMVFVRVSVSCMLLHDSEDPHRPCGARSVESTVEALCPGLRYPRPRSCVWLLI